MDSLGFQKVNAPIFVVGPPRSGTTLTAKILGRHSRQFMPGETHFFYDIYSRREVLGSLAAPDSFANIFARLSTLYGRYNELDDQIRIDRLFAQDAVRERLRQCKSYKALFSTFMKVQMEAEGKCRWGNNAPKDIFQVREIREFFPEARFIVCVRDVRDFLLSYKYKWKATSLEHVARLKKLYHPVVTSMLWKSSVGMLRVFETEVPVSHWMLVPYERLVTEPEATIRDICRLLGEDFEPDMLNINFSNSSDGRKGNGIFSSSIGKWRGELEPEDAWLAQWLTESELERLGYRREKIKVNLFKVAALVLSTPLGLWRALDANRDARGPLLPYLARRLSTLMSVR
jgi:Sulfotransferase domain.